MKFEHGVYLVTEPSGDLAAIVANAVAGGVDLVQVRDKGASTGALIEIVQDLRRRVAVPIVVNDDLDAAQHAAGVHVGVDDLPPSKARRVLGPSAIVGWSVNDPGQLDEVEEMRACDYVAASPVWATHTKPDHQPPLGLEGIRAIAGRTDLPVVAIGGIDVARAAGAVAAGADAVAVVTAITRADDPRRAVADLVEAVREGRGRR
ncbi:thiamine phosphate synthase [Aeromicrobium phragmitis]|uniref:Thiamine-phosphate synthase n=1 Tax=Aeromicrobium phragmitis TaxID=2478914 RepID=A0A3L8PSE9_9ACTN|nr:thiamine phosphate synthase [Aeromicrobium phragmitis]RLV56902.1 thiamine phosphate synthase [Aeromicrobium phragmitis]